jgi:hypothetical protein
MSKELVAAAPAGKQPDTSELLGQTFQGVIEGLTGLASSDKKDLVRSIGFIFQRWRGLRFIDALRTEWNQYREKGRIKDNYMATEQHAECLQEMLDLIDSSPDQIRFEVLKKILLVSATEEHSSRDSVLPQQYMRLVRELNSGEVLVLLTTLNLSKRGVTKKEMIAEEWLREIANDSGLRYFELVAIHEEKLITKNLIRPRNELDRRRVHHGEHNRLTELGYQLCEFISHYSNARETEAAVGASPVR